jgi:hypothetical protein
VSGIYHQR